MVAYNEYNYYFTSLMACLIDLKEHFVYPYDGRLQGYNPVIATSISLISDCGFSFCAEISGVGVGIHGYLVYTKINAEPLYSRQ